MTIDAYVGTLLSSILSIPVFLVKAQPNAAVPFCVFRQISGTAVAGTEFVGAVRLQRYRYQIDIWDSSAEHLSSLSDTLRDALNRHAGSGTGLVVIDTNTDLSFQTQDDDLNLYRFAIDYTFTVEHS